MKLVLTGIYSGIGKYLIQEFRKNPDNYCIGVDLVSQGELPEVVRESLDEYFQVDLADIEQVESFLSELTEHHSQLDLFIHNAGMKAFGELSNLDNKVIRDAFHVNTMSSILFAKHLFSAYEKITYMIMGSNSTFERGKEIAVYGSSKAALNAFAEKLSYELTSSQRIFVVCPSVIATEEYVNEYNGDAGVFRQPGELYETIQRIYQKGDNRIIVPVITNRLKLAYMVKGSLGLAKTFLRRG